MLCLFVPLKFGIISNYILSPKLLSVETWEIWFINYVEFLWKKVFPFSFVPYLKYCWIGNVYRANNCQKYHIQMVLAYNQFLINLSGLVLWFIDVVFVKLHILFVYFAKGFCAKIWHNLIFFNLNLSIITHF